MGFLEDSRNHLFIEVCELGVLLIHKFIPSGEIPDFYAIVYTSQD
jgi:hypothetical protein